MISPVPLQSLHGTWTCGTGGAGGERRQRLLGRTQRAQSRARGGTDLLHHGAELAEHDLGALAVTARALLDGALLAALAVAALADDVLLERELRHLALVEVGKRNVDAVDEVLALARTLGTPASSAAEAEGLRAQNGDDDQARSARRSKGWSSRQEREGTYASSAASAAEQLREQVLGVHAAAHAAHAALEAGLTSLVVDRPLLRVREDLVAEGEGSRAQAKMERKSGGTFGQHEILHDGEPVVRPAPQLLDSAFLTRRPPPGSLLHPPSRCPSTTEQTGAGAQRTSRTHAWVTSLKASGSPPLSGCSRSALRARAREGQLLSPGSSERSARKSKARDALLAVSLLELVLRVGGRGAEEVAEEASTQGRGPGATWSACVPHKRDPAPLQAQSQRPGRGEAGQRLTSKHCGGRSDQGGAREKGSGAGASRRRQHGRPSSRSPSELLRQPRAGAEHARLCNHVDELGEGGREVEWGGGGAGGGREAEQRRQGRRPSTFDQATSPTVHPIWERSRREIFSTDEIFGACFDRSPLPLPEPRPGHRAARPTQRRLQQPAAACSRRTGRKREARCRQPAGGVLVLLSPCGTSTLQKQRHGASSRVLLFRTRTA